LFLYHGPDVTQFQATAAAAATANEPQRNPHLPQIASSLANTGAWAVGFIVFEVACQLMLLIPPLNPVRVILRSAAFAGSIVLAAIFPRLPGNRFHPATGWALLAVTLVMLGTFHPASNTMLSCLATLAMYFSVVAPLLWTAGLNIDERWLRRIIITIWGFNALSALIGVLQTIFPEWTWLQPNLSAVIENMNAGGEGLKISLANGARVFRPMGLSDQPGAAAVSGLACIVFGTALTCRSRNAWFWFICLISMVLGLFCILLSQVRSVLVMSGVSVIAFSAIMILRGDLRRLTRVLVALAGVTLVASAWAVAVAGEAVTERLATLVADDPRQVYYENRGHFLEQTLFYTLPRWPLGAGLGRWGMMNYYFGDPDLPNSTALWAEIQWTSWAYDGGVPLIAAYTLAMLMALWQALRLGRSRRNGDIGLWAAVIFAFNIGCVAVTFNYPLFMGQTGLDFWLLNAALVAAAQAEHRRPAPTALPAQAERPMPLPSSLLNMNG
jgi:hypothetical protein